MRFRGFRAVFIKETIHIFRDPRTLFLMLLIPGIQITIFGYAIDTEVQNIRTTVYNLDRRPASRDIIDAFRNTGYFKIIGEADSDEALLDSIVRGDAQVGIKIPPDYSDLRLLRRPASIQVLIDGGDSNVALQALNVSQAIALRESVSLAVGDLSRTEMLQARARVLFNPDLKTANFMVPGLVGIVMQVVTMFLTAFAIVREREYGTLEQLMVTPISPLALMMGKLLPYGCIGIFETSVVLFLMRFVFLVPIAGSLLLLAGFALLFLFASLGLGLMISTVASNQVQAIQMSFVVMLPSILLSGFIFPQENMPDVIYWIGQVIPVTYFIRVLRGIILRGATFHDLWHQGVALLIIGVLLLGASTRRFRKSLG